MATIHTLVGVCGVWPRDRRDTQAQATHLHVCGPDTARNEGTQPAHLHVFAPTPYCMYQLLYTRGQCSMAVCLWCIYLSAFSLK